VGREEGAITWLSFSLAKFAASCLFLRHNIKVSIKGLGFWRAMWPRADMSWSRAGSTPGPHIASVLNSNFCAAFKHWVILWSASAMNYWGQTQFQQHLFLAAYGIKKMMQRIFAHGANLGVMVPGM
jgi:hypothetical protein